MKEIKCLICEQTFSHPRPPLAYRRFYEHIAEEHSLTKEEYAVNYFYQGKRPTCACGCGLETHLKKGLRFNKYYADHKNKMPTPPEVKEKLTASIKQRLAANDGGFATVDKEKIELLWQDYKHDNTKSLTDIAKEVGIDRRTFRRLVLYHGLCSEIEFAKRAKFSQINSGNKKRTFTYINAELMNDIYDFIEYNHNNNTPIHFTDINTFFGFNFSSTTWKKRLEDKFGPTVLEMLKHGLASKEELDFLFVLRYYFGNKVKSNVRVETFFFDYRIGPSLLVEYNGEYWHEQHAKRDERKEKLAISRGYKLYKIPRKSSRDFKHILNIQNLLQEE